MKTYTHETIIPSERLLSWIKVHHNQDESYIAPHWHRSIELNFTFSGKIDEFTIGDKCFETKPGMILVVNSQEVHSVRVIKREFLQQECVLSITYPYPFVLGQYHDIDGYYIAINDPEVFSDRQKEVYHHLQDKLAKVINIYQSTGSLRSLKLNSLLLDILIDLLEYFLVRRQPNQFLEGDLQIAERLQFITQYIQDHYQEDLGLETISQLCHLSKTYLARFIKQHLGMTLGDYISKIRAQKARQELIETTEHFTTIALNNGFSGLRTMNRALEKYFHQNARQLRSSWKSSEKS